MFCGADELELQLNLVMKKNLVNLKWIGPAEQGLGHISFTDHEAWGGE